MPMTRVRLAVVLGATVLLAWCVAVAGQQQVQPRHDGAFWRQQSREWKMGYMLGFMEGHREGVYAMRASYRPDASTREWYQRQTRLYADVTNMQLVSGMDAVYMDFRNLTIPLSDAMFVVLRSLRGKLTSREAEEFLQFMRWEQHKQGPPPRLSTTGADR
jgi:hypothetical protein